VQRKTDFQVLATDGRELVLKIHWNTYECNFWEDINLTVIFREDI